MRRDQTAGEAAFLRGEAFMFEATPDEHVSQMVGVIAGEHPIVIAAPSGAGVALTVMGARRLAAELLLAVNGDGASLPPGG